MEIGAFSGSRPSTVKSELKLAWIARSSLDVEDSYTILKNNSINELSRKTFSVCSNVLKVC